MKKNNTIIIIVLLIVVFVSIFILVLRKEEPKDNRPSDTLASEIDININTDDGDEKIDWNNYKTYDITLSKTLEITVDGIYNLMGTISNGNIIINTNGNVKLNLNNVKITNTNGPCIYIKEASDVVINISGTNTLTDSKIYSNYDEDVTGTIYSADDITFDGDGKLIVNANYQDGIVSKDDLKIINGDYEINSQDDGIRGKDSVYILNGNYIIKSSGDGIKSTNDTDEEKGFISINNGNFNIESGLDGIQAETKLVIDNGIFNLKTGGGSANSSIENDNWGRWPGHFEDSTSSNNKSAKGLKAGNNIVINNGTFVLDTSDDAIHSNNYVGIITGNINITSGDDGIHADTELIIDDGTINITKSYEGLEASKMTINGGIINVTASDDGINIAGGVDSSSKSRPGENRFNSNSNNILTINNGTVTVNASGDGIDVNGNCYMANGLVTVYGPTNSGNGSLDYDSVFEINGGVIIAGGASGMDQSFSTSSKLNQLHIRFNNSLSSDDIITIVDNSNNEIIKYESPKTFSSLVVASSGLVSGKEYTIKFNNETYETFTISSNKTTIGSTNGMMPNGNNRPSHSGRR